MKYKKQPQAGGKKMGKEDRSWGQPNCKDPCCWVETNKEEDEKEG